MSASFEDIQEFCKKYENDEKYVYKKCNNQLDSIRDWLIVMEKNENTKTNEERKYVVDKKHAKYRANELKVVDIINVYDFTQRATYIINSSGHGAPLRYEIGKIVKCDKFDENIDRVCSGGIHYFKTLITAYCYDEPVLLERRASKWMDWDDDGRQRCEINYFSGNLDGLWKEWSYDGSLHVEGQYRGGSKHGLWIIYHSNGNKWQEINFKVGVLDGRYTEWYNNGQKIEEGNYINGKRDGVWIEWYQNGKKRLEENYNNGAIKI